MVIISRKRDIRREACIERLIPVLENLSEYDVPEIEELSLYFGFTVYAEKLVTKMILTLHFTMSYLMNSTM